MTTIKRSHIEVLALKRALVNGGEMRSPLPEEVVDKILEMAEYWCCVEKECKSLFDADVLNVGFYKFGPMPAKVKRVEFHWKAVRLRPYHDDHFPSYWACGEVNVKDKDGNPKLGGRQRILTNEYASLNWKDYVLKIKDNQSFLKVVEKGDTLEIYFNCELPAWEIYLRNSKLVLYHEAPSANITESAKLSHLQ